MMPLLLYNCPGQLSHSFLGLDQLPICSLSMLWNIFKNSFGKTFCQHHFLWDITLLFLTTVSSCLSTALPPPGFLAAGLEPPQWYPCQHPHSQWDSMWVPVKYFSPCNHFWFLCCSSICVDQFPLWWSIFGTSHMKGAGCILESPGDTTAGTKGMAWCYCNYPDARMHACVLSHVQLCMTLWSVAHHTTLSMGFPRQECWSRLLFPSPTLMHI